MATIAPTGEDAILRADVEAPSTPLPRLADDALVDTYDLEETAKWIIERRFKIVGLQFPDDLLPHSIPVLHALRRRLARSLTNGANGAGKVKEEQDVELYIMADTTYGSCCVDEVAAQHVTADAVVHYGNACMSSPSRLPVFYVFPKRRSASSNASEMAARFAAAYAEWTSAHAEEGSHISRAMLFYDISYHWMIESVSDAIGKALGVPLRLPRIARLADPSPPTSTDRTNGSNAPDHAPGDRCCEPCEPTRPGPSCAIFYLGPSSRRLTHLVLTNSRSPVWALDPDAVDGPALLQTPQTNKLLMRRYGAVQRARDADTVGIVVGTLGIADYLPMLAHLRAILRQHRKKSYTVAVGKLRPEKLANFAEVECWVLVACPENALLDGLGPAVPDSKAYPVPVVTPFELEIALSSAEGSDNAGGRHWDGTYILNFRELLGSSASADGPASTQMEDDGPVFSTATGKYRTRKTWDASEDDRLVNGSAALSLRDSHLAVATAMGSSAGAFLAKRTYRGLDPKTADDRPASLEVGRSGIARDYGEREGEADSDL